MSRAVLQAILEAEEARRAVALATVIAGPRTCAKLVVAEDGTVVGSTGDVELDGRLTAEARALLTSGEANTLWDSGTDTRAFVEALTPVQRLVIVGSGHLAVEITRLGAQLGYEVIVVDFRRGYATPERFPEAADIVVGPLGQGIDRLALDRHSHVVLVSHGHEQDCESLRHVLQRPVAYVGMIGSRRRIRTVFDALAEEGVRLEQLGGVHAPVGLDIGAVSPAEIAVSVMAEITLRRRGGTGAPLSARGTG